MPELTQDSSAVSTGDQPCGNRPPRPVRLDSPGAGTPGSTPTMASTPSAMNSTIAVTLISANQNSNCPNDLTLARLTAVSKAMKAKAASQDGAHGARRTAIAAPAIASKATTTHQW